MSKKSDSLPASTGGDPNDILAFLESAPESIRGWAGEQSKLIRQELDAQATSVKPATTASAPLDENETALAELDEFEEEVPVFRKRAKAKAARKAAKPASENADNGPSERKVVLISLVVALVVGIGSSAYFASQWETPETSASMGMPAGHPDISDEPAVSVAKMAQAEAALQADPDNVDLLISMGGLRFDNGEYEVAEEHWSKAIELDPESVAGHYYMGFAYLASEPAREQEAVDSWNRVIDLAPDSDYAANVKMHVDSLGGMGEGSADESADPAEETTVPAEDESVPADDGTVPEETEEP